MSLLHSAVAMLGLMVVGMPAAMKASKTCGLLVSMPPRPMAEPAPPAMASSDGSLARALAGLVAARCRTSRCQYTANTTRTTYPACATIWFRACA